MERTETAVLKLASRSPQFGQFRVAELLAQRGVKISPSGVRAIWKRHGLETVYKRLSALGGRRGGKLTDAQDTRLRRAKRSLVVLAGKDKLNGRREHLLGVAARAFARRGYDGTTLQEVAEAAGILPGSMYHYFDSKDDLFAQVHTEGFRTLNEAVDRAIEGIDAPWERLQAALAAQIEGVVSANAIDAVASGIMFNRGKAHLQKRMTAERDSYEARIRAMIEALPLPPEVDRSLLRLALLGAVAWTRVWYKQGKKTPAEIVRNWIGSLRRR